MSSDLDRLVHLARELPGVASADPEQQGSGPALRVRLTPDADGPEVALAVGRLVACAGPTAAVAPDGPRYELQLPSPRRSLRPRICRVDLRTDEGSFHATVELATATATGCGSGDSGLTSAGTRRAVATATLRAVRALLPHPVHLELEHVELSVSGQEPVALVHLSLVEPDGVQRLSGSAIVRNDESHAIVRACLDALNRRVEALGA